MTDFQTNPSLRASALKTAIEMFEPGNPGVKISLEMFELINVAQWIATGITYDTLEAMMTQEREDNPQMTITGGPISTGFISADKITGYITNPETVVNEPDPVDDLPPDPSPASFLSQILGAVADAARSRLPANTKVSVCSHDGCDESIVQLAEWDTDVWKHLCEYVTQDNLHDDHEATPPARPRPVRDTPQA